MFGVPFDVLRGLTSKNKNDHVRALELWASENDDACRLACQIADPARVNESHADAWMKKVYNDVLPGESSPLVTKSPIAQKNAEEWVASHKEQVRWTGW
jgi:3-methyladenine DNA glycosylase AlkD